MKYPVMKGLCQKPIVGILINQPAYIYIYVNIKILGAQIFFQTWPPGFWPVRAKIIHQVVVDIIEQTGGLVYLVGLDLRIL